MENILFIETRGMNPTGILKTAIARGYHPFIATEKGEEWQQRLLDQHIEATLLTVSRLASQDILEALPSRPVAVITLSDQYLEIGADVARQLELPHTPVDVLMNCRNKQATRELVAATAVKQPAFARIETLESMHCIVLSELVGFPLIFKPLLGHSSLGVHKFYSQSEVDGFFQQEADQFDFPYIVEHLIEDAELISVEGFIDRIGVHFLGCSSRLLGGEGDCVELGGIFPYKPFEALLYQASQEIIQAITMSFGAFHIEYLVRDNQVYLVEVNPRFPNGPAPSNISRALGCALDDVIIELFVNGFSTSRPVPKYVSIARALYSEQDGVITNVHVPNDIDADVFLSYSTPFKVSRIRSNADRFGFVITASEDVALLDDKVNAIMKQIVITRC
ncbi:ATP-grasp domain-containing protein [Dickeya oryzae]|uniref:ATP-grasp domain-containing protein n=1 Tax=Dickeya oryzae TaxID=1240404 RepID=UPI001AECCC8C|nr:ATP-grasp domain-containing protein [Dickeya oryzae]MBP2846225.1 ATP-grasp domain-containing protein [Dickeya oryzae]